MPHIFAEVTLVHFVVRVLEDPEAVFLDILVLTKVADSVWPLINAQAFLTVFEPFTVVSAAVGPPFGQETYHSIVFEDAFVLSATGFVHQTDTALVVVLNLAFK